MTLQKYQETVSPLFKEYNKFLKKNAPYFKKANYGGILYDTYDQYIGDETVRLTKQGYTTLVRPDYLNKSWSDGGDFQRVLENPPADVKKQYDEFIAKFSEYFSQDEMDRLIDRDEAKGNKRSVRRAIDNDFYVEALKDGAVSPKELNDIFVSVGVKMPKRVLDMKTKVETQGYNRSFENAMLKRTKEFEDNLRKELGPHYDELKNRERRHLMFTINDFESDPKFATDMHSYLKKFERNRTQRSQVQSLLNVFFEGAYVKGETNYKEAYKYSRKPDFDKIMDRMCTDYAEGFIAKFVARLEHKLRVVNAKIGAPVFKISNVSLHAEEFECLVEVKWPNGAKLVIEATVIIAGGYNIQVEHYRYLLKTFHNGKYIDLEKIDALEF